MLHGILKRIGIQILQDPPQPPSVGPYHQHFVRHAAHQIQAAHGEPFLKLTIGLLYQFHQVNIRHIQLHVAGTGLGGLHQILCQCLQALGFLIQHLQVGCDLGILYLFTLQQIHIIDNGCERRLDIMGHIGYQIRLQAFAFNLLHKGRIQSAADIIDMLSHILFLAAETDRLYLIMCIAPGNAADCSIQHIPLHCLLKHLMENIPVQPDKEGNQGKKQYPVTQ